MILTGHALRERFQALDDYLVSHQSLWRPKPFSCPVLPWEAEHVASSSNAARPWPTRAPHRMRGA